MPLPALLLLAVAPAASQWPPLTPSTVEAIDAGYWSYVFPATLTLGDDPGANKQWCRAVLFNLAKTFPGSEGRKGAYVAAVTSPVTQRLLEDVVFTDDCLLALWYVHVASHQPLAPGDAPELQGLDPAVFNVTGDVESLENNTLAQKALGVLNDSRVRAAVVQELERGFLVGQRPAEDPRSARPSVDLALMSACPYGIAAEKAFAKVLPHFATALDVTLHFILYDPFHQEIPDYYCAAMAAPEDFNATTDVFAVEGFKGSATPNACSMHGTGEANEDLRQMAVRELYGSDALWKYVGILNDKECDPTEYDRCSAEAAEEAKVDYEAVVRVASANAPAYVNETLHWLATVGGGATSSPTLFINGRKVSQGALQPLAYAKLLCRFFTDGHEPKGCKDGLAAIKKDLADAEANSGVPTGGSCVQAESPARTAASRVAREPFGGLGEVLGALPGVPPKRSALTVGAAALLLMGVGAAFGALAARGVAPEPAAAPAAEHGEGRSLALGRARPALPLG